MKWLTYLDKRAAAEGSLNKTLTILFSPQNTWEIRLLVFTIYIASNIKNTFVRKTHKPASDHPAITENRRSPSKEQRIAIHKSIQQQQVNLKKHTNSQYKPNNPKREKILVAKSQFPHPQKCPPWKYTDQYAIQDFHTRQIFTKKRHMKYQYKPIHPKREAILVLNYTHFFFIRTIFFSFIISGS